MLGKLALPAIRELIEAGADDTLHEVVNRWLSADLAELVDALETPERVRVLRLLKPGRGGRDVRLSRPRYAVERAGHPFGSRVGVDSQRDGADDRTALPGRAAAEQAGR